MEFKSTVAYLWGSGSMGYAPSVFHAFLRLDLFKFSSEGIRRMVLGSFQAVHVVAVGPSLECKM